MNKFVVVLYTITGYSGINNKKEKKNVKLARIGGKRNNCKSLPRIFRHCKSYYIIILYNNNAQ